ncbi:MAG: sugar transferase [Dehalococcoidia bacterium]
MTGVTPAPREGDRRRLNGGAATIALALSPSQLRAKRIVDLALAVPALVLTAPVLFVAGAAIFATMGRPIFFRQVRLGARKRPFVLYKLRTMVNNSSDAAHREFNRRELLEENHVPGTSDGAFKLDDPRVTPVGRWLRKTSIDELPQLLNVIRGEMSLVGPRPVLDWEAAMFDPSVELRFAVPPGITGRWQVGGRNRVSMRRMLDMDVDYVRSWSLLRDLEIIVRTPLVLLRGDGAR